MRSKMLLPINEVPEKKEEPAIADSSILLRLRPVSSYLLSSLLLTATADSNANSNPRASVGSPPLVGKSRSRPARGLPHWVPASKNSARLIACSPRANPGGPHR
jgi:hypothetical protein